MMPWKYNMLHTSDRIRCYKQITKLNTFHNCLIEKDIVELYSLGIWFDQIYDIVPTKLEFYNGKCKTYYTDLNIIKIVNDESLDKVYDSDNVYQIYYKNASKYRNLLNRSKSLKSLVGKYILDWHFNKKLIRSLKSNKSEYIELNYYIYF